MKFRRSAPLILISSIVLVVVLSSVISSRLSYNLISSAEDRQLSPMQSIVAFNLRAAEDRARVKKTT